MFGVSLCVEGGGGRGALEVLGRFPSARVDVYEFIEDFPASWVVLRRWWLGGREEGYVTSLGAERR